MRSTFLVRLWSVSLWRNERGVVLAMALVVMALLMAVGSTALFSGYINLRTSTNLKLAAQANTTAEAAVHEALYRLSRQETQAEVIVSNVADPNWEVHIMPDGSAGAGPPLQVATIQNVDDWPHAADTAPVILRYKKDAAGKVIFYDRTSEPPLCTTPPFCAITLPAPAAPDPNAIPPGAHPVIQIQATGLDDRDAKRQILAEVASTVAFPPPAPLSSGVDVDMQGAGFIDGVNHDHRIYITDTSGNSAIYGNDSGETTNSHTTGNQVIDSPDDNKDTGAKHGIANPNAPANWDSPPRLFNMQITSSNDAPAWVNLHKVNPDTWTGVDTEFASPIALSTGPVVLRDTHESTSGVLVKGLFTWGAANGSTGLTSAQANPPFPTPCTGNPPTIVCRPPVITPFPSFQEFLGLDDVSFQQLLDNPDTTEADLQAGKPPLGFTYIDGNHTFNNNDPMPGTNDFGLMYVRGNLRMNGGQRFKGLIYVDGDLDTTGDNVLLGAVMVQGLTQTDAHGNFTLLYSRKAAELGIQAGHPWRILSWEDTAMQ